MSKELTLTAALTFLKGQASLPKKTYSGSVDVAGTVFQNGVQTIGTTDEVLTLGDVSAPGSCLFIKNLDATNYVEIGIAGTTPAVSYPIILNPGRFAILPWNAAAIHAKANTAACQVEYALISA